MPVICDGCDEEISLGDAHEDETGDIVCSSCLDDEGDEDAPLTCCRGCGKTIKVSDARDSRKGPLCPLCAHGYELERFTPPDHDASKCGLCQQRKAKGMK